MSGVTAVNWLDWERGLANEGGITGKELTAQ